MKQKKLGLASLIAGIVVIVVGWPLFFIGSRIWPQQPKLITIIFLCCLSVNFLGLILGYLATKQQKLSYLTVVGAILNFIGIQVASVLVFLTAMDPIIS